MTQISCYFKTMYISTLLLHCFCMSMEPASVADPKKEQLSFASALSMVCRTPDRATIFDLIKACAVFKKITAVALSQATGKQTDANNIDEPHEYLDKLRKSLEKNPGLVTDKEAGYTPLHKAAEEHLDQTVAILLERKADVNAHGTQNETPLFLATRYLDASHKTLELLLAQKNIALDAQSYTDEDTALHNATYCKDRYAIIKLLEAGADKTLKGYYARTPAQHARKTVQDEALAQLIENYSRPKISGVPY